MHVSNKLLIVLGFLVATFFGCSDKSLNQDTAKVDVAFKIVADAKSDFAAVASTAEVKISADGMPTLTQSLTVTSSGISGTITGIVAGPNRKFEVFVYDATNKLCYYGSAVGEVTVGGTANISMTLYRTNGEGNAVINGSIQGTNTPPTISLTSPANNAQFTLGNTIQLAATAADADGSVSSVTFYSGPMLVFTDNSAPYSCNFTPSAAGTYTLTAVATDNAGSSTTSAAVSVIVVTGSSSSVYEAENAAISGGAAKNTNHTGYSGTGFVDGFFNSTTAQVSFTVSVASAGSYSLTLRYSAGNGASSNTGLYVNGTKLKNVTCNATSNWDTWADEVETVTLNAGNNTILYKTESSSGSCINLDKITIAGSSPTSYTITYNGNGNTGGSAPASVSVNSGASAVVAAAGTLVRTNYNFAGWNTTATGSGTAYAAGATITITSNMTLYAIWTSGGSTTTYEAENAVLSGGAAKNTNHTGYSGTGFVDGFFNSTTAQVSFTVNVASAGSYSLTLRYSAGNGASSNTGLYVNGTKLKNVTCNATSNWDTWADEVETVTLNAGSNTILYKTESSSGSCINLDRIVVLSSCTTPVITSQPASIDVPCGSTSQYSFSVQVTGSSGFTYQWQWNTDGGSTYTNCPESRYFAGTTTAQLTTTPDQKKWLRCVITDGCGIQVVTGTAVMSVPVLSVTSPTNVNVPCGSTATQYFSVVASGSSGYTYQWQWNTDGGNTYSNCPESRYFAGTTTAQLSTTPDQRKWLRCVVTDGCGIQVITGTALMSVSVLSVTSPTDVNVPCGSTASQNFSVVASGSSGYTYQWQWNTDGGSTYTNCPESRYFAGTTTAQLTTTPDQKKWLRCVITDGCGIQVVTGTAVMSVPVLSVTSPTNVNVPCGSTATQYFSVVASGSSGYTYQWQWNTDGGNTYSNCPESRYFAGTTTAQLSTTPDQRKWLRCVVTDGCGIQVITGTALMSVSVLSVTSPTDVNVPCGSTASQNFSVVASGSSGYTYQWQWNTDGGSTYSNCPEGRYYAGVTTATLTTTPEQNKYLQCVVRDACGNNVTSSAAYLYIAPCP
jgi:uncharacterized repeat protein (TIGR02543 family)